ncbi:hypothetical protein UFOVP59_69 [uncultured Caudovirales phage]|uniref:Uncharacterized protein n=1 Tax=uncultured Caudovirales phage TaxID=2100421 RepID=A0A6J7WVJ4_9CAUD|nr:hypothetical protein UFOVP59_69 [uncultured Caudovirales phage]CAB5220845.1 hypothetical protein UFOVP246_46 [uncultured Caudovirales phage]
MEAQQLGPCQWLITRVIDGLPVTETVFISAANDTAEAAIAALAEAENPDPAEIAHTADREAAKAYLAETDWYITRAFERGVAIPDDVKAKRAAAVEALND